MIIVAGRLYVDPGQRDAYLAATFDVAAKARAAAGCLDFVQAADPLEPGRINIFEQWGSDEDVERFRTSGSDDEDGSEAAPLPEITDARVQKFRISAVEAP